MGGNLRGGGFTPAPGAVLLASVGPTSQFTGTTPTRKGYVTVNATGTYRVSFRIAQFQPDGAVAFGRIYVDGVPRGTLRSATSPATTFTEDISVGAGSRIEYYVYVQGGTQGMNMDNKTVSISQALAVVTNE